MDKTLEFLEKRYGKKKPVITQKPVAAEPHKEEKMEIDTGLKESTVYQPLDIAKGGSKVTGRETIESMLKTKEIYTEKIANKAFLLDKYDLGEDKKQATFEEADKEHIGIRFDSVEKLEEYKKLREAYKTCLKLNQMWNSYISNLITERDDINTICARLVKAEFVGAIIFVVRSPNESDVGVSGIVLLETKRSFIVLTEKNTRKMLLKKGRVFGINWQGKVILIYGDSIIYTGSERTKSKFKERKVKPLL